MAQQKHQQVSYVRYTELYSSQYFEDMEAMAAEVIETLRTVKFVPETLWKDNFNCVFSWQEASQGVERHLSYVTWQEYFKTKAAGSAPHPDNYFQNRMFLWAPMRMWKISLSCPKCNLQLTHAGLYPEAREVVDIDSRYYLIGLDYPRCSRCKLPYCPWSKDILQQLDPCHRNLFPAVLTKNAALDNKCVTFMKPRTLGNSSSYIHQAHLHSLVVCHLKRVLEQQMMVPCDRCKSWSHNRCIPVPEREEWEALPFFCCADNKRKAFQNTTNITLLKNLSADKGSPCRVLVKLTDVCGACDTEVAKSNEQCQANLKQAEDTAQANSLIGTMVLAPVRKYAYRPKETECISNATLSTVPSSSRIATSSVSDRHIQIAKWIRENLPETSHLYDIWHIAKGQRWSRQGAMVWPGHNHRPGQTAFRWHVLNKDGVNEREVLDGKPLKDEYVRYDEILTTEGGVNKNKELQQTALVEVAAMEVAAMQVAAVHLSGARVAAAKTCQLTQRSCAAMDTEPPGHPQLLCVEDQAAVS
ncbi:hypothetical protein Bbelb_290740 [Branchiostoma belcheri]|nr:hypothetical protein Bbelb_290740 [Branchiostoma belcheri]